MSLHLHTLSGPVVEHCRRIAVSPYDLVYPEVESHWTAAGIGIPAHLGDPEKAGGAWADVQDFNWLKRQHSPNWCILATSDRSPRCECTDAKSLAAREPLPPRLKELDQCVGCWEAAENGDSAPAAGV